MTQKNFAQAIGSSVRTYQARLFGSQPKWQIAEIIKASQLNHGEIRIEIDDGIYDLKVKKVVE